MFSGIVQAVSEIISVSREDDVVHVRISLPEGWILRNGQSVAIDGICSTVVECSVSDFGIDYMSETLAKTTAGAFVTGRKVNLERSLLFGEFVDGHLMQGHIDGRGTIVSAEQKRKTKTMTVRVPETLVRYIVKKGSIAINGVSLTVSGVSGDVCSVSLIPYTLHVTNLGDLAEGDEVNIEVDLVARYLERLSERSVS